MTDRRLPAIVLVLGLATWLAVAGHGDGTVDERAFTANRAVAGPVADGAALTSSWFCAAGTSAPDELLGRVGIDDLIVQIANPSDERRVGSVTWFSTPLTGPAAQTRRPLEVGPWATVSFRARDVVAARAVSALVETLGGGVVVEHTVTGARGSGAAPCASDPSRSWYLATGVTARDATEVLALFNPFPSDAVVDLEFHSEEGRETSARSQGVPIPGGTTRLIDLGSLVVRRESVAVAINARVGQVIVDRVQSFDGSAGRRGLSLALASSGMASTWWFPDGLHSADVTQRWHVYNPTSREAEVSIEVVPDEGATPQPIDITVAPGAQVVVDTARDDGVPAGIPHSATIRALNGVPIVAERSIDARGAGPRRGWSAAPGSPIMARRWGLAVGEATAQRDLYVVVHNPGTAPVRFSLAVLSGGERRPVARVQRVGVGAAGRVLVRLGDYVQGPSLPVVVEADGDVVVVRELDLLTTPGVSMAAAIPLG